VSVPKPPIVLKSCGNTSKYVEIPKRVDRHLNGINIFVQNTERHLSAEFRERPKRCSNICKLHMCTQWNGNIGLEGHKLAFLGLECLEGLHIRFRIWLKLRVNGNNKLPRAIGCGNDNIAGLAMSNVVMPVSIARGVSTNNHATKEANGRPWIERLGGLDIKSTIVLEGCSNTGN